MKSALPQGGQAPRAAPLLPSSNLGETVGAFASRFPRVKVPVNKTQFGQHRPGRGNTSEVSIIQLILTVEGKYKMEAFSCCPDVMNKVLTSPRLGDKVKAQ